jgi:hypothetical protein
MLESNIRAERPWIWLDIQTGMWVSEESTRIDRTERKKERNKHTRVSG